MELYDFNKLSEKLDALNYAKVAESRFQVVRVDLTEEEKRGKVTFGADGIYLSIDGYEHRGYMYIKKPDIAQYGLPRFHINNCEVIVKQRNNGYFDGHYFWHNSSTVDLTDRRTGQFHEAVALSLCGRCKEQANINNYTDTKGFYDLLDKQGTPEANVNVDLDMFGYVKDWTQISKKFRIENGYTCNSCTIVMPSGFDRRFIHVHHINGNKLVNGRNNLECLCVLCHSNSDERHVGNFKSKITAHELLSFVTKYKDELLAIGNKYVKNYVDTHKEAF